MNGSLDVYMDGVLAGYLSATRGTPLFSYNESYVANGGTPISLSMRPGASITPKATNSFFWGLLPDNPRTLDAWASRHSTSPKSLLGLMRAVGSDVAGALQVLPAGTPSSDAEPRTAHVEWFDEASKQKLIADLVTQRDTWGGRAERGRWSLAGAQAKIAVFSDGKRWGTPTGSTPTTHIIKPDLPGYTGHIVNEYLCQAAARNLGLLSAEASIELVGDHAVYISRRYDRVLRDGRWHRLHQEDLCQALAVVPDKKYQADGGPGVGQIADLLASASGDRDGDMSRTFFSQLAYNALIAAPDAHAKNYSIIHVGDSQTMAPLYDTATGVAYFESDDMKSAMKIGDSWSLKRVSTKDLSKAGVRLGLTESEARSIIDKMRSRIPNAFATEALATPDFARDAAERLAERIAEHSAGQRESHINVDLSLSPSNQPR